MTLKVENNIASNRFETKINGYLAFIDYISDGETMTLLHTEVPQELGGEGVGGKLVKASLDFARDNGLRIVPQCPFVIRYIERHENYQDLVGK